MDRQMYLAILSIDFTTEDDLSSETGTKIYCRHFFEIVDKINTI